MCDCPTSVKRSVVVAPTEELARKGAPAGDIVLTICDCDRRLCPVGDCTEKIGPLNGQTCRNGHRS